MSHGRRTAIVVLILVPSLAAGTGCQSDLHLLENWMTGSFSSAAQHRADPDRFQDIRLHMVPIWKQRADGPWLYVEQAAAQSPQTPYRQRVYQLRRGKKGALESVVYGLPGDPLKFAGVWQEPARLDQLSPRDLVLREGCTITLHRRETGTFVGSTTERECQSSLRGATYATSEVVIGPDRLMSWDRGFDAQERQVWGATAGAYRFIKTAPSAASAPGP